MEHLGRRAADGFTTVTELADTLVWEAGLPFRQAHQIVSALVSHALAHQLEPDDLNAELLGQISMEKTGTWVSLPEDALRKALDPVTFVLVRKTPGGAAPEATSAVLRSQADKLEQDRRWIDDEEHHLAHAQALLSQEIRALVGVGQV